MESREDRIIALFAHDYRHQAMTIEELTDMIKACRETIDCDHACTNNCESRGCECGCGEQHIN